MSQATSSQLPAAPDVSHLITEDDEPVESFFVEKQQRLLTGALYDNWAGPDNDGKFLACANVGIFNTPHNPAIVPDVLLSLDVKLPADIHAKAHCSYYVWEYGKAPDVVIEIVANQTGGEQSAKKLKYAFMHVLYYVVFDPSLQLGADVLTIYSLQGLRYRRHDSLQLPGLGLGLTLWEDEFEGFRQTWLRWTDEQGNIIHTGKESADRLRAERLEKERERAETEAAQQHAETLAAQLRALGHDPAAL